VRVLPIISERTPAGTLKKMPVTVEMATARPMDSGPTPNEAANKEGPVCGPDYRKPGPGIRLRTVRRSRVGSRAWITSSGRAGSFVTVR
jgi:hypothetical protein